MWANPARHNLPLMCRAVNMILTNTARLQNLTCGLFACNSGTTMPIYSGLLPHLLLRMEVLGCKIIPAFGRKFWTMPDTGSQSHRACVKMWRHMEASWGKRITDHGVEKDFRDFRSKLPTLSGRKWKPRDSRGLTQHFTGSGQFGTGFLELCPVPWPHLVDCAHLEHTSIIKGLIFKLTI